MSRAAVFFLLLLCASAVMIVGLNGCGGGSATLSSVGGWKIQHVVIIFQENRTPDNLFQDQNLINAGADIASSGMNSLGQTLPLAKIDLGTNGINPDNYDLSHAHAAFVNMCDYNAAAGACAMDGADKIMPGCAVGVTGCWPANPQFMYVNPDDVSPYFQMAEQYTFGDRMFQTNQGPSFPAHQYIISGTSAPATGSKLYVAENPLGVMNPEDNTGCTAPANETVGVINPAGVETTMYPCFEHATLTDLLDNAGISWRYYAPGPGSIWTAPNAIQHMCGPNATPPNATACIGDTWKNKVVLATKNNPVPVLNDIANHQLPTISWVMPNGLESDHALSNDGSGPSYVASIVNAIGNSSYWENTVILLTWDDWGGWYDHVPPPKIVNSYEYGFRVPLIVMSPFAKQAYISHVQHDFGSILHFIEEAYRLPSLGYADADADDLSDCFDFLQSPLPFKTIVAPLPASYFLNDHRAPTDPDDD